MTINANASGHNMTIGAGGVLKNAGAFDPSDVAGLWSWAFSGENQSNITQGTYSGGDCIDAIVNLASPGINDFTADGTGALRQGRPLYSAAPVSVDGGLYSAPYVPLTQAGNGTPQWLNQVGNLAANGEFYVIFAIYLERDSGTRYFAGNLTDGIRVSSVGRNVNIVIGSSGIDLTTTGPITDKAIIEVWRDASNNLHCWSNGVDVTDGTPSSTATFAFSGFGGGDSGSGSDDWLFEEIAYSSLPSAAERLSLRNYVNGHWALYA